MLLVREVFHCKPGKVHPLAEKFRALSDAGQKAGMPRMRILTDFSGPEYWTLIAEMEVADLTAFEKMVSAAPADAEFTKAFESAMSGYHDLVDHGHREIYRIES